MDKRYYVCRLCRFVPVNKVTVFLPISPSTARRRDKRILATYHPDPDLDNLWVILVDGSEITSARLEAFNATISRIVKRACGYRNLDYLYLKIKQEATPLVPQL